MPDAKTADGVVLHWEERGAPDGPLLVGSMHFNAPPSVFEGLWADLARDHRVVTYDLRGVGASVWEGPHDLETDAADLLTVIDAAGGSAATVVAFGDGSNRAVRAAAGRPDLIRTVVGPAGNPLGREAAQGGSGLASSVGLDNRAFFGLQLPRIPTLVAAGITRKTACTALGWFILGSSVLVRSGVSLSSCGPEVTGGWGPVMTQPQLQLDPADRMSISRRTADRVLFNMAAPAM